ncbi:tRNA dihydrouridine(20/20a) synthase DusA [Aerobium aerolatum]|uniref:tRNA-dihydrouridine(20/20a) synthase n=1 Tax=Aquamicrobium aerolatum DSM 21857 TaxID=1121003 RepID=A0A1I3KXJ8_9HYPH|nr:tRNA dihydrouridine(20/20a) synthase DusA [Aquamicrobium aerolatum]SFI77213.1 tRNA-dihydrouridine synthase A [Aquamicrobium aerolatum DSM 21857]
MKYNNKFAIAPMMDWTDRHCRFLFRQLTKQTLLYTEMVVADAIIHGDRERLLGHDVSEHPIALQLGGSDPVKLAAAARASMEFGYDEINLNVGCPSDRVQSGTFGACLMRTPELVAECVSAMKAAVPVPVTVKCRIGVDDQDIEEALDRLTDDVLAAGADAIWVHARKAWLQGLSPKENRDIPPLNYERVYRLKQRLPNVFVGINGGIKTLDEAVIQLEAGVDGVMLGRAAYHDPSQLADVDRKIFGAPSVQTDWAGIIDTMAEYAARHIEGGGRLVHITRHMTGLFHGLAGARRWRQILSTDTTQRDAGPEVIQRAFAEVRLHDAVAAA